jgi:metal-dependent HD superfamily phosphatase/phosphodiesterase
MNKIIEMAIHEVNTSILPKIKASGIKQYKVIPIYRRTDYLGYYENGTCFDTPVIKLNMTQIKRSDFEYPNIGLYEIILSTILHELGHAIQEIKHKIFDEAEAENFAFEYVRLGRIKAI